MKMPTSDAGVKIVSILCFLLLLCYVVAEADPIVVKGSRFFYKTNGEEFYIKGVTYQSYKKSTTLSAPPSDDLLTDKAACQRDIDLLKKLNVNTIRVFYIDPTQDHRGCLNAFADAGIYVLTDLSSDSHWLDPSVGVWDTALQSQFFSVVDALAPYNNILGLSLGRTYGELQESDGLPFWKAALRDLKAYIKEKNYRDIPIGYETDQSIENGTIAELNYLTCDEDQADFLGLWISFIDYDKCTDTDYITDTVNLAKNSHTSIPMYMETWGCKVPSTGKDNRTFHQVNDMYSKDATAVLSGGFVSDYFSDFDNDQNYGRCYTPFLVVDIDFSRVDAAPMDGFSALSSIMATISLSSTTLAEYSATATAPPCPTKDPSTLFNASSTLPPTPYDPLCKCMMQTLRCVAKSDAGESPASDLYEIMYDNLYTTCNNYSDTTCTGIGGDGSTGQYGAFNNCNITEVYSWAANKYWESHGDASCDLNDTVTLRAAPPAPSSDCQFLLDQVGTNGEQTLSATLSSATSTMSAPPSPSSSSSESRGLSIGAKAGIGLGAAAIVIALLLGILFVLHRKKQARKGGSSDHDPVVKSELDGSAISSATGTDMVKYRHDDGPIAELPEGQGLMAEIPAVNPDPVELPEDYIRGELLGSTVETGRRER
ncbi:Glucanosyltransferase-domain-containing protein [Lophiotrema nucula]|uniref:1,3-beta-glucanosyltransferase n=1 Tax=Lophiotrema nucula TaxID=690887 RepID=A0A6A5YXW2_9PLEO|nr:Glucanosyltransferase-domain-containing protein [Lophiotrema nucula]